MDGADAVGDVDPRTTACLTQKGVHIVRLSDMHHLGLDHVPHTKHMTKHTSVHTFTRTGTN